MKNTNKLLSAVIAATIALCASVQISAIIMNADEAESTKRIITNLKSHLRQIADPKLNRYSGSFHSQAHQERIQDIKNEIAELEAEYNEYMENNG